VAGSIAKWLIVIALSGIALSILFTVAIIVIAATIVAPKLNTLTERLKAHPAMKNGSAKDKCMAFFSESGHILSPEESDDMIAQSAEHACSTPRQIQSGAQMYDAAVSDPAHAAHSASSHAATVRESALASHTAAAAAGMPDAPAGGEPQGHSETPTSTAAPAAGLGAHA